MRTDLTGLTHYPKGYGVVAAHGNIDMGYRWRAGMIERVRHEDGRSRPWVSVDGEQFPTGGAWRGVQVKEWLLEGLPVQEIDPFAWPPVPGAKHWPG